MLCSRSTFAYSDARVTEPQHARSARDHVDGGASNQPRARRPWREGGSPVQYRRRDRGGHDYPARIDRSLILLDPNGEARKTFIEFGWNVKDTDRREPGEELKTRLEGEALNDAIHKEIVSAVLPAARLRQVKDAPCLNRLLVALDYHTIHTFVG